MLNVQLSDLKYITPKTAQALKKNGIETVRDLLFNFPHRFDDYTITKLSDASSDTACTIAGVVQSKATVTNTKTKLSIMNFYIESEGEKIRVTIFNRHFLKPKINYGVFVKLTGKIKEDRRNFVASEIQFDEFSNSINPVFNIKGLTDAKILELKGKVFRDYGSYITDIIPDEILSKYNLIGLKRAVRYINIPEDMEEVKLAIKRIKFEELFIYQLKIKYMLYMRKNNPQGIAINYDKQKVQEFIEQKLPFKLTLDQQKSLDDILYDISHNYKMNRLLQGEVGSGKTVVAALALYAVITAGYQGAIMVPTEVLAKQHYNTFSSLFKGQNVRVVMLSSSVLAKERKEIISDLANHSIDIIIGTHALFQKDVIFAKLGLVITDEEHRFGVRQRLSIVEKGYLVDHLKMSATPIPRTLAISVLGDSDISYIKTMPGSKKEVITKYVEYSDRAKVLEHMKEELKANHQIYMVCPMIDESEVMDLRNATAIYTNMKKYFQGVCEVGLIHSKLKPSEKEQVMSDFNENKIQILVSTSVIEVGVNVINATTMVILDADRFGIAQLHQMRGRVRRSDLQAYCFLISNSKNNVAIERLKLVEANSDGFVLANEDLLIRGPGDFFGEKQSGTAHFQMADILLDKELLELANKEAEQLLYDDTNKLFTNEAYQYILNILNDNYQKNREMFD